MSALFGGHPLGWMLLVEPAPVLLESFLEAARQPVADDQMATLVSAELHGLNADCLGEAPLKPAVRMAVRKGLVREALKFGEKVASACGV